MNEPAVKAKIFSVDVLAVWYDGCGAYWQPIFTSPTLPEALAFYQKSISDGYIMEKDGAITHIGTNPDEDEMMYKVRLSVDDLELMKSSYQSVSVNGPNSYK